MTSRSLLTALLTFVLLAPLAAIPGRANGTGGAPVQLSVVDHAVLGARSTAVRFVAEGRWDSDGFAAGGAGDDDLVGMLPRRIALWPRLPATLAPYADLHLPPCGLRAGPRQPTGPPLRS